MHSENVVGGMYTRLAASVIRIECHVEVARCNATFHTHASHFLLLRSFGIRIVNCISVLVFASLDSLVFVCLRLRRPAFRWLVVLASVSAASRNRKGVFHWDVDR